MALELSVVVPCFNEEFNVEELARRVLGIFDVGGFAGELILVDDGSADGTRAAIEALATRFPGLVVGQFHTQNAGIAAAWRTGTAAARGRLVSIIDADLQYQPEDLLRMRRELIEHTLDIVQGWRSPVGRKKETRYYLSRGLNSLLNATFGMHLRDNKSGFVVCAKEVMEDLLTYKGSYHYWQSFIMVAAHAKGYSYKEIEILFENRRQGQSFLEKTAYRAVARSFVDLPKAVWEYRVRQRYHDSAEQFLRRNPVVDRTTPRTPARDLHWKAYMGTFERTHWLLTRDVERYYETLRKTQWLAPAAMRDLQDEKLRRLVRHAYRNVPYYRGRMQELKLRPEDIRGQADLPKLPFLIIGGLLLMNGARFIRNDLSLVVAELLEEHGLSGILRTPFAISEARPVMRLAEIAEHGRGFKIRGYTQDHISLTGIAPRLARHQVQPTSAGLRISLVRTSAASPTWRGTRRRRYGSW